MILQEYYNRIFILILSKVSFEHLFISSFCAIYNGFLFVWNGLRHIGDNIGYKYYTLIRCSRDVFRNTCSRIISKFYRKFQENESPK